jgi:hypothetical protein
VSARLNFIEQPGILDRDHRLVGESCHQLDLLVGEGINLAADKRKHTDCCSVAQERNTKIGSVAKCLLIGGGAVFRIGEYVVNVNGLTRQRDTPGHAGSVDPQRSQGLARIDGKSTCRRHPINVALPQKEGGLVGETKPGGGFNDRREHGL